ncbi:MAG TPA: hypothetical protein DCL21_06825 [Alphaproteobacteria bacterium]|nr:hypothetical protein [Alphaproteobacteria bacterium]
MSECVLSVQINDDVLAVENPFYDDTVVDFYEPEVVDESLLLMDLHISERGNGYFWNVYYASREDVSCFVDNNPNFNITKDDGDFYLCSGDSSLGDDLSLNMDDFLPALSLKLMPSYLPSVFESFIEEFKGEYRGVVMTSMLEKNLASLGLICTAKTFGAKKNKCRYGIVIS